jgi:hypothetical protein
MEVIRIREGRLFGLWDIPRVTLDFVRVKFQDMEEFLEKLFLVIPFEWV